jgi:PAS domain S-box-containing protein
MLKGWLFVAITSLLLYVLVRRLVGQLQAQHEDEIRRERERQQALEMLSAIAENSQDAIFVKDTEGRYLLFNPAAGRFVGRNSEDVLGLDDRAIFPPEQAELVMVFDRHVQATGQTETNEEVLETPAGSKVFLATKGPLRDSEGGIIGIFGVSRDITKRKQAEDALAARNAELERFNRASVDRELDMIALKQRINDLSRELGRPEPYPLDFLGGDRSRAEG